MIDKVQKIREEVERLQNELIQERNKGFGSDVDDACILELQNVLTFIDSLQEEPVSKVWHDSNEEPNNMSHCLVFYGNKSLIGHYLHYEPVFYNKQDKAFVTVAYPHPTGYKVEQKSLDGGCVAEVHKDKRDRISISDITSWCYLNDLHNLTQKEEPVSEDTMTIRKDWFEHCKKSWYNEGYIDGKHNRDGQFGGPVSEDLEEASKEWLKTQLDKSYADYGETKMMELTRFDGYAMLDAIEFGAKWQKEQMMAKAVDGDITFDYYGDGDKTYGCIAHNSFCLEDFGLKDRDKVKVLVIKED